jgi:hypothetical protein
MFDVHQSIYDQHGEIDEARVDKYINGLLEEFANSPEAQPIREAGGVGWAGSMMEFAIDYIGSTPVTMSLPDFNEVVFDLFPRKMSTRAENAGPLIAELRAFWSFVHRQYGLDNAKKILASLDEGAADRLRKKLADPANFGMSKSMFMMGSEAGFDMTTPEGLAAFQTAYNTRLLANELERQQQGRLPQPMMDDYPPLPPLERPSGEGLKRKREEKKRQRQAKKRNRKK